MRELVVINILTNPPPRPGILSLRKYSFIKATCYCVDTQVASHCIHNTLVFHLTLFFPSFVTRFHYEYLRVGSVSDIRLFSRVLELCTAVINATFTIYIRGTREEMSTLWNSLCDNVNHDVELSPGPSP